MKGNAACVLLICTRDDPLEKEEQDPRNVFGDTEMDKTSILVEQVTPAGLLPPTLSLV